jgi:hypothetical protein
VTLGLTAGDGAARRVRAGPFDAVHHGDALRWIRFDGVEILRSIQLTARDRTWGTVEPVIEDVHLTREASSFSVNFRARYDGPDLGMLCDVEFRAGSEEVTASLECRATRPTCHQRFGLMILHPPELAGRSLVAATPSGAVDVVVPTRISGDTICTDVEQLAWEPAVGYQARLRFEGSLWEMEDQRNWSDASFKTYCPPLRLPHPVALPEGASFRQSVTLVVSARADARRPSMRRSRAVVEIEPGEGIPLPSIGLARPAATRVAARPALARLRHLRPGHLHVVLDLESPDWKDELSSATIEAELLGARVELEVSAPVDGRLIRECVSELVSVPRQVMSAVLAFPPAPALLSSDRAVSAWRSALSDARLAIPVGGGARANFAELSRAAWPLSDRLDTAFVCITPQIHAFDRAAIVETLEAQSLIARDMVLRYDGRPVSILCSLRPRFNAYSEPPEHGPSAVRFDPRQGSPFAAAWTVGSLQALTGPGVGSLTYHETVGPAGVLGRGRAPGSVPIEHPAYRVLQDVLAAPGARVLPATFPERCPAFALRSVERTRVLIANLDDRPRTVDVRLPSTRGIGVRWLCRARQARPVNEGDPDVDVLVRRAIAIIRVRLEPDEVVCVDGPVY